MSKRRGNAYEGFKQKILASGVPNKRSSEVYSGGRAERVEAPLLIRTTPVMWGIPMDEVLYSKFFTVFFQNANVMPWDGIATTESTYLPDARNQIHKAFVKNSDLPYLFMLDSDVMIPPNAVDRLLAHKLPIVSGWYRNKQVKSEAHPIVYDFVSETDDALNFRHRTEAGTGVERVGGVGAGCILMSRKVAEALGEEPYDMNKSTEDFKLCKKLLDLGIPLHVDWSINCAHLGVRYV